MSRNKYDPGLPGGGRVRYTGPDAYAAQQREYETRSGNAPLGFFNAPAWYQQVAPGATAFWYADLDPQTPDRAPPAVAGVDNTEFWCKYWSGATLQRFVFTYNGLTFTGWTVVLEPGWWHVDFGCQILGAVGATLGGSSAVLIPTRVLATGLVTDLDRAQFLGDYQGPYSGTSFVTGGAQTIPVKEESALFLWYECNNANPTIVPTQQGGTRIVERSYVSGFRIR